MYLLFKPRVNSVDLPPVVTIVEKKFFSLGYVSCSRKVHVGAWPPAISRHHPLHNVRLDVGVHGMVNEPSHAPVVVGGIYAEINEKNN